MWEGWRGGLPGGGRVREQTHEEPGGLGRQKGGHHGLGEQHVQRSGGVPGGNVPGAGTLAGFQAKSLICTLEGRPEQNPEAGEPREEATVTDMRHEGVAVGREWEGTRLLVTGQMDAIAGAP